MPKKKTTSNDIPIHEASMSKLVGGKLSAAATSIHMLHKMAQDSNADAASTTYTWCEESQVQDDCFVPYITIGIKRLH